MPIYAGETVRVFSTSLDWDDTIVTPSNGSASITIWNEDAVAVVENAPMLWLNELIRWQYDWLSSDAGTFTIEVTTVTTPMGGVAKETRTVRLVDPRPEPANDPEYFIRVPD
jgi:hypothetical protein